MAAVGVRPLRRADLFRPLVGIGTGPHVPALLGTVLGMMDPLKHNELLDTIQKAIRNTGAYTATVDALDLAEIEEVLMLAKSQYRQDHPISWSKREVPGGHWLVTVTDPYRPE